MKIFAYGSNLHVQRLLLRTPSAKVITPASICGYRWVCNKVSQDGSAKANIFKTKITDDRAWGVIYDIHERDKTALDHAEGLGKGYDETFLDFRGTDGREYRAQVYLANKRYIKDDLMPFEWYKRYMVSGARLHRLPLEHVTMINNLPSIVDPDRERRELNYAILNSGR